MSNCFGSASVYISGIKISTKRIPPWMIAESSTVQLLFVLFATAVDSTRSSNMAYPPCNRCALRLRIQRERHFSDP